MIERKTVNIFAINIFHLDQCCETPTLINIICSVYLSASISVDVPLPEARPPPSYEDIHKYPTILSNLPCPTYNDLMKDQVNSTHCDAV